MPSLLLEKLSRGEYHSFAFCNTLAVQQDQILCVPTALFFSLCILRSLAIIYQSLLVINLSKLKFKSLEELDCAIEYASSSMRNHCETLLFIPGHTLNYLHCVHSVLLFIFQYARLCLRQGPPSRTFCHTVVTYAPDTGAMVS